jgi:hypothetical protein
MKITYSINHSTIEKHSRKQESLENNPKTDREKEQSLKCLDKTSSDKNKSNLGCGNHKVSNHSKRKYLKRNLKKTSQDNQKLRKIQTKPRKTRIINLTIWKRLQAQTRKKK